MSLVVSRPWTLLRDVRLIVEPRINLRAYFDRYRPSFHFLVFFLLLVVDPGLFDDSTIVE